VVLLSAIVGFEDLLQQTPRAVTAAPPSLFIFPPLVAVENVIEDAAMVVSIGTPDPTDNVVKLIPFPYAVPALLVA
jgi:hypothetical protein